MTDDIKALEARKDALSRAVEEATAERDEVRRQLAEARGERPPQPPVPQPARAWVVAAFAVGIPTAALIAIVGGRAPFDHLGVVTCSEISARHAALDAAGEAAFERALAARGLTRMTRVKEVRSGYGGVRLDVPTWQPFTYEGHRAIADDPDEHAELVRDGHGGVWRVRRAPVEHHVDVYRVRACQWGCWDVPSGAYLPPARSIWQLADGETFRGELAIAYDQDALAIVYEREDCPLPP